MEATAHSEAARLALAVYEDVLRAVRGDVVVRQRVRIEGERLVVGDRHWDLSAFRRVFVCGAGKASPAMAQGLADLLGDRLAGGLVVTKTDHSIAVPKVAMMEAGHPVPDERSLAAGEAMLAFAESVRESDLVLFALSGGASALLEKPVHGLELEDLQVATRALLQCGAPIEDLNAVRSVLSQTKAGGLARAFARATVVCLVLSDVVGNSLETIGSGPFSDSSRRSPLEVIEAYGLREVVAPPVLRLVSKNERHDAVPEVAHAVLADNALALAAARESAERLGFDVRLGKMAGDARRFVEGLIPPESIAARGAWIFGGETTTVVRGPGRGGRCQEMAAAMSDRLARMEPLAFLAGSTDGTDGPTDVAGGVVDGGSSERARSGGQTAIEALARSDSYAFLKAAGGLVRTGPTGSNVNDLALLLRL